MFRLTVTFLGVTDLDAIGETTKLIESNQTRKVSPYFVPRILNNLPAGYVSMKYGMMGGVESASTACATSLHCIGISNRLSLYVYYRECISSRASWLG